MPSRSSSLGLTLVWATIVSKAVAQKKYAVYYDPNEDGRNPKGSGFQPVGPENWDEVNYYDDFYDWGNLFSKANQCNPEASFKNGPWGDNDKNPDNENPKDHLQSPVILENGPFWSCNARHGMHPYDGTDCNHDFKVTPYSLRAEFKGCTDDFMIDMSRASAFWELKYVEIKSRSEHVTGPHTDEGALSEPKDSTRYDAELTLAHSGTDHLSEKTFFITMFLNGKSGQKDHGQLNKFLQKWEAQQEQQYEKCGMMYDEDNCELDSGRRHMLRKESAKDEKVEEEVEAEGDRDLAKTTRAKRVRGQEIDPYRKIMRFKHDPWYYQYEGSLTVPPCTENAEWNVMQNVVEVSPEQINRVDKLLYQYITDDCTLGTVGKRREASSCEVDTSRPLHYTSYGMHLVKCDEWVTEARANP